MPVRDLPHGHNVIIPDDVEDAMTEFRHDPVFREAVLETARLCGADESSYAIKGFFWTHAGETWTVR